MPVKDQKIGRGNAVVMANALFDLDEVIDAIRYWADREKFQLFKVKSYIESRTSRGLRSRVKIHFKKDIDFYLRQEFDIELNVKRGQKGRYSSPEGKIKTLTRGNFSAGIDTKLVPDYDDNFTKKGESKKLIHNLFFELIYKPKFLRYKVQTGIGTGKTMNVIKNKIKSYSEFKPTS